MIIDILHDFSIGGAFDESVTREAFVKSSWKIYGKI